MEVSILWVFLTESAFVTLFTSVLASLLSSTWLGCISFLLELKFIVAMWLALAYNVGVEVMCHFCVKTFKNQCAILPVASLHCHYKPWHSRWLRCHQPASQSEGDIEQSLFCSERIADTRNKHLLCEATKESGLFVLQWLQFTLTDELIHSSRWLLI